MAKERKFEGRKEAEKGENYDTVKTGLPSDRFSAEKQIVTSDEMTVTKESIPENVTNSKFAAAKNLRSKMKVRPDVSVDDLGGKQVGGVPLAVETGLRNAAGARASSPADDMSRTPYTPGKYRPTTAYGKKRSEDLFELDNTAIEQVVPIVEDMPDLKEKPDSTFVYNGRQQFKQTRQKKNFSFEVDGTKYKMPQQLLNDASVDFVTGNKVVYSDGQIVVPLDETDGAGVIPATADYPSVKNGSAIADRDRMHKSNYLPRSLKLTIANGHITGISIEEDRYVAVADPTTRDEANLNWQVDANNVAKTMVKIQKEMGRETTDKWTPLAYVINEPYQYNMLLHDIELTTGANMATAYRAAVSSLAYQRNITKKDGINAQRNAIKMILEGYAGIMANNDRNTIGDLSFKKVIFQPSEYRKGSVAALIAMFDSTGKYQTKADLLGMQRSLGLHLSQADNNINPLKVKRDFMRALDKAHLFSTVDGEYNPYLPIYQTREIKVINPISLNYFLRGWKNPNLLTDVERADAMRDTTTGTYAQYAYEYTDLRMNKYTTRVQMPLLEGLLLWLMKHEGAFVSTFGEGDVNIPWTYNFMAPSLLEFLFCSSAQDVNFERNISYRDVLFAGEQSSYIWDDLTGLDTIDPLYSTQLKIGKYDEPLTMGKMAPDTAIREMYSDHKQLAAHSNDGKVQYYEPWYVNERSLAGTFTQTRGYRDGDTPFYMSFPSIRDGVRHEYVDLIKSMDVRDIALSMDRKLMPLPFTTKVDVKDSSNKKLWTLYYPHLSSSDANKIKLLALRYDSNSDGRVVSVYDLDTGRNLDTYGEGMYCIPKEIGVIDDDYTGINVITGLTIDSSHNDAVVLTIKTEDFHDTDTSGINTEYYNGGIAKWITSYRVEGDSNSAVSIDRSAALTATFYNFFATNSNDFAAINSDFIAKTGLVITKNYRNGNSITVPAVFNAGSSTPASAAITANVATDADYIWTVLQRFMQPVNPFANAFALSGSTYGQDPFEIAFWFGVCGFLSADYTQHVLERLSEFDQLGFDYTEDMNHKISPILR